MGLTSTPGRSVAALLAVLLLLTACTSTRVPSAAPESPTVAATPSPSPTGPWTIAENAKQGTRDWRIPAGQVATDDELAGYADHTSVLPGETFGLHVGSTLGDVTVDA